MPDPIELKRKVITGAKNGPHFLITGGVHGDEFESMMVIRRLIREVKPEQLSGRLTLVPIVNEAAFWSGMRWAEEDKLDLARTCPGSPDGSVTERTAHALSELIRSAGYYLALHRGGQLMRVSPKVGECCWGSQSAVSVARAPSESVNDAWMWSIKRGSSVKRLQVSRAWTPVHSAPVSQRTWSRCLLYTSPRPRD